MGVVHHKMLNVKGEKLIFHCSLYSVSYMWTEDGRQISELSAKLFALSHLFDLAFNH
jgi:hypothetical protein